MSNSDAVLSIDLEFFAHTPAHRSATGESDAEAVGLEGVEFLLEELSSSDAVATFFVVSEIADTHPDLLRRIAEAGHEIASHTHSHQLLTDLNLEQRREELLKSKHRLEATTGATVDGFRAPAFDFGADHFEALAAAGYAYDSSIAPCRRIPGWYGGEYDTIAPFRPADAGNEWTGINEVPVGVFPRIRLPLTGTWIRFFGSRYTTTGMRLLSRRGVVPVLYVHPWELVDLPAVEGIPSRVYYNTGDWMRQAVRRVLAQSYDFGPVRDIAATMGG